MLAFILAGLLALATVIVSLLILFAAGMSDNPSASASAGRSAMSVLIGGGLLAAAVAGSHWLHMSW